MTSTISLFELGTGRVVSLFTFASVLETWNNRLDFLYLDGMHDWMLTPVRESHITDVLIVSPARLSRPQDEGM